MRNFFALCVKQKKITIIPFFPLFRSCWRQNLKKLTDDDEKSGFLIWQHKN